MKTRKKDATGNGQAILKDELTSVSRLSFADRVYEVYNNDMSVDVYYALKGVVRI